MELCMHCNLYFSVVPEYFERLVEVQTEMGIITLPYDISFLFPHSIHTQILRNLLIILLHP
jgi:hypothetical protein